MTIKNQSEMMFDADFNMGFNVSEGDYDQMYLDHAVLLLFRTMLISESFNGPTPLRKMDITALNTPLRDRYGKIMIMYNEAKKQGHPLLNIRSDLGTRLDNETLDLLGQMLSMNHKQRVNPNLLNHTAFKKYMT